MLINLGIKEPNFLLLYSPQKFDIRFGAVKPEGSLGLAYLAGALRRDKFNVKILDCCVGNGNHSLEETFYHQKALPDGMMRVGLENEQIIREARDYDVIGISSIFTAQTLMVEETVNALSEAYPEKQIILGGVNARSQMPRFFKAGATAICISEAEKTIVEVGKTLRLGNPDFRSIPGIALPHNGHIMVNPAGPIDHDLDSLPIPAWDMQPLERYWKIARPHGGGFSDSHPVPYAPAMTSRGCPFHCSYCHISREGSTSDFGNLGKLRLKSLPRVIEEISILKSLGVKHVFLEDDSLLAKKKRALTIFRELRKLNLELSDVNGVNLAHMTTRHDGRLGVDEELLEEMAAAGFKTLIYPVESGSQRIIDKYATGKLNLAKHDVIGLIRKARSLGIEVGANYLFGYPDETYEEMIETFVLAKQHMDAGLNRANFHLVTPFPGTAFYEQAVREDLFLPGADIADLDWIRSSIRTKIPSWLLEFMITRGWEFINNSERIARLRSMAPKNPS